MFVASRLGQSVGQVAEALFVRISYVSNGLDRRRHSDKRTVSKQRCHFACHELGEACLDQIDEARTAADLKRRLERIGDVVSIQPKEAAPNPVEATAETGRPKLYFRSKVKMLWQPVGVARISDFLEHRYRRCRLWELLLLYSFYIRQNVTRWPESDRLLLYRHLRPGIIQRAGDAGYRLVDL